MNWLTHSEETRRGKILDSTANAQLMETKSTSSKSPNRDRRTLRSSAKDQKYEFQKQKAPDPVTSGKAKITLLNKKTIFSLKFTLDCN
jgi:hypothetical protein